MDRCIAVSAPILRPQPSPHQPSGVPASGVTREEQPWPWVGRSVSLFGALPTNRTWMIGSSPGLGLAMGVEPSRYEKTIEAPAAPPRQKPKVELTRCHRQRGTPPCLVVIDPAVNGSQWLLRPGERGGTGRDRCGPAAVSRSGAGSGLSTGSAQVTALPSPNPPLPRSPSG